MMNLFTPIPAPVPGGDDGNGSDGRAKKPTAKAAADKTGSKQTSRVAKVATSESKTRSTAILVYDTVLNHLCLNAIPPFTEFKCKHAASGVFKWFIEAETVDPSIKHHKPPKLVVVMQVEMRGQNPDNPEATYWQFTELYRRSLSDKLTPLAIGMKPRKARLASGSRSQVSKSAGPS